MVYPLDQCDLMQKKILIRVDFNVPLDPAGHVADDSRLKAALKTIQYALHQKAAVILISHMGRPKGEKNEKMSLKTVLEPLESLLQRPVYFVEDCISEEAQKAKQELEIGEVLLLENLRFYEAEEDPKKDPSFAQKLAQHCDFYINEAFACSHRSHASITEVPKLMKGQVARGFELDEEIEAYESFLKNPKQPFVALVGGSKISSKIEVLLSLLDQVQTLIIGGAMAHPFLKEMGHDVGKSFYDEKDLPKARKIRQKAEEKNVQLLVPVDLKYGIENSQRVETADVQHFPKEASSKDIGEKTLKEIEKALHKASTLFWNGPFGVFEEQRFSEGTLKIAKYLASSPAVTFVGGGDTVSALHLAKVADQMTFVSTGGGACLELIEKKSLPGIDVLTT